MPKHVDRYIPEHCDPNEVICINCGSIFREIYSNYNNLQGTWGTRGFTGDAFKAKAAHSEARRNEECGAKPKAKLKPGVQPWRPT